jgi:hypothetical protein
LRADWRRDRRDRPHHDQRTSVRTEVAPAQVGLEPPRQENAPASPWGSGEAVADRIDLSRFPDNPDRDRLLRSAPPAAAPALPPATPPRFRAPR